MWTPRICACAANSITTAHNGKPVVTSLFSTYPFPLLPVKAGTCTLRNVLSRLSPGPKAKSQVQPQCFEGGDDPVCFSVSLESFGCVVWSDLTANHRESQVVARPLSLVCGHHPPTPAPSSSARASTRHACDQLVLDRPHSQWRLCEIFLRRYSRVTSAQSGRGFTVRSMQKCQEGPVVVQSSADETGSTQPLLKLLHLHRLVSDEPRVPAFEPLSPSVAQARLAAHPFSGHHSGPTFSSRVEVHHPEEDQHHED